MKLLLTSAGITNKSIAEALDSLTKSPRDKVKVGLVPTAANAEEGNKDWFIQQITDLNQYGFGWVDIVDFSAPNINWQKRLSNCNIIYISGGNTFHLLNEAKAVNFNKWMNKNTGKVYVGASAGSIIMTPTIKIATVEPADINHIGLSDLTGFSFVDFEISPHTPNILTYKANEEYFKVNNNPLYALDDTSAIKIDNGDITLISEGKWRLYK